MQRLREVRISDNTYTKKKQQLKDLPKYTGQRKIFLPGTDSSMVQEKFQTQLNLQFTHATRLFT